MIKRLLLILHFTFMFANQKANELYKDGQYLRALTLFDSSNNYLGSAASLYQLGDDLNALKELKHLPESSSEVYQFISLINKSGPLYSNYIKEKDERWQTFKSPWLAGTLSALIPGAGQLYNGHYQSAALSFLLNALTLLTAIEFSKQNKMAALASGSVFSIFYLGNIYSAASSASNLNEQQNAELNRQIKEKYFPVLYMSF